MFFATTAATSFAAMSGVNNGAVLPDGIYAGVGVGVLAHSVKSSVISVPNIVNESGNHGGMSFLGQFSAGYDRNICNWFNLGAEGFINYHDASVKMGFDQNTPEYSSKFKSNYSYGINLVPAWNIASNARIFSDIGVSFGSFEYYTSTASQAIGTPSKYTKDALPGLVLGLGSEMALTSKLSLRGAYQCVIYQTWKLNTVASATTFTTKFHEKSNQFIVSMVYHFK